MGAPHQTSPSPRSPSWQPWEPASCCGNTVDGKKVPINGSRRAIDPLQPKNMGKFENLCSIAKISKADGLGFVFISDGLGGVDLDACRDPTQAS